MAAGANVCTFFFTVVASASIAASFEEAFLQAPSVTLPATCQQHSHSVCSSGSGHVGQLTFAEGCWWLLCVGTAGFQPSSLERSALVFWPAQRWALNPVSSIWHPDKQPPYLRTPGILWLSCPRGCPLTREGS